MSLLARPTKSAISSATIASVTGMSSVANSSGRSRAMSDRPVLVVQMRARPAAPASAAATTVSGRHRRTRKPPRIHGSAMPIIENAMADQNATGSPKRHSQ